MDKLQNIEISSIWINFKGKLMAYVMKSVKNEEVAKDILQNIFIKIQLNIAKLKNKEKLENWIFALAHNAIIDYFRSEKKSPISLDTSLPIHKEEEAEYKTHQLSACIINMIKMLPPKYSEALLLTEIKGMSQKELAAHLDISYSGAKSRVQRGREMLKEQMLMCCAIEADKYGNIIDYQSRKG